MNKELVALVDPVARFLLNTGNESEQAAVQPQRASLNILNRLWSRKYASKRAH